MSDPLERLRGYAPKVEPPDTGALRVRARRIVARRNAMVGVTAGLLVVIGAAALLRGPIGKRIETASQSEETAEEETGPRFGLGDPGGAAVRLPSPSPTTEAIQEDETVAQTTTGARAAPGMTGDQDDSLRVDLQLSSTTATPQTPVRMRLVVCNDSESDTRMDFRTGQRYDFEVRNPRTNTIVWRWSHDKAFAQVLGSERIAPGCKTFADEPWYASDNSDRPVGPGRYEVTGIVTSVERMTTAPKSVCAVFC